MNNFKLKKTKILYFLVMGIFSMSCKSKVTNWYLIEDHEKESKHQPFGYISGYVDEEGDTIIPLDKYVCFTDTVKFYALVYDSKQGIIGINKNEEKLFTAVWNGEGIPIEESDGMIQITENNKYGFANHKGEIIIEPKYQCVRNFIGGKAKVSLNCFKNEDEHFRWDSNDWIYIDKKGNKIN